MKKTIKSLLLGLILVFAVVLTACNETCDHTPGASWRPNETDHWKICDKCGKEVEKAAHTFGEWKTVTEPSVGLEGKEYRQCSVCLYYAERAIPAIELATGEAAEDVAVYAKVPAEWTNVNCYYWGDNIDSSKTVGWPGKDMTLVDATENIWGFIVPAGTANVIFNNGTTQTADLLFGLETNLYTLSSTNTEGKYLADYSAYTAPADQPELNKYPVSDAETFRTIYVQLPATWEEKNIHYWGAGVGSTWPGEALTVVDADKNLYSFELSSKITGFLFDAGDGKPQTGNIAPNELVNGYVVADDNKVTESSYADGTFTPVDTGPVEVYVRGTMTSWGDPTDEFKLTVDGTTATITITLKENDEFKIATQAWTCEINFAKLVDVDATLFADANGNIKCLVAGTYTITVTNYAADSATATIVAVAA